MTAQIIYSQTPSYLPTNGLVGYWPFNGNANDQSGNGLNGAINGATLTTDRFGNSNSSYEFNGTSNIINFGSSQSLINLSNFTYSLWINRSSNCADDAIIISNYGGNWEGNLLFGKLTGSGNTQIRLHKLNQIIGSETDIVDNQWINLVAVKDLNSIKIYKNGVLIQATDLTNFVSINNTSFPFVIGGGGWGNSNYFMGKVDDLGVWNRALSQSEITSMYNGVTYSDTCNAVSGSLTNGLVGYWPFCGNANDDSGNGLNGVVNGASLTTDRFGNNNSAYSFNGVNDYVEINNDILSQINEKSALSISYWFNTTSTESGAIWGHGANNNGQTGVNTGIGSGYYNGVIGAGNYTGCCSFDSSPVSPFSTWHNAIVVFDGNQPNNSKIKIYIDGILNTNIIGIPNATTGSGTSVFIGRRNIDYDDFGEYFEGLIDDVGIWNRALSQQEITQLFNQNQCITNITVTDTLIINVGQLSYTNPVTYANNITIYPNPANTQVNISFNNITDLTGGNINIINSLGQQVATTPITLSGTNTTMPLNTWGGTGLYFVQIVNAQGQILDIKKIILQ